MTITDLDRTPHADEGLEQTLAQQHPHRWRLNRAGIVNVWYYYDTEFDFSGGRLVLRGTNGSGKSRALEMLLPFLLDGDRRKMDATGSGKVRLQDLMKAGGEEQPNRLGYLWLELARDPDPADTDPTGTGETAAREYLTLGAFVRFAHSTGEAKVWYFTTPLRVGTDLPLLSANREPLARDQLTELIGADRITESATLHRDRVRGSVFGLTGDAGRERYAGMLQLLHTLRSPDVGNRIEEGRLPQILSDALPPLSEDALNAAGEQLDGLSETRAAQERLEQALGHVTQFLGTYRRYAASALAGTAAAAKDAAEAAHRAERDAEAREGAHRDLVEAHAAVSAEVAELDISAEDLESTISGIKESKSYADARDLDDRDRKVTALGHAADTALHAAGAARAAAARVADDADARAEDVTLAARHAGEALDRARGRLEGAGVRAPLPDAVTAHVTAAAPVHEPVRTDRLTDPGTVARPQPATLTVTPDDLPAAAAQVARVASTAADRSRQAGARLTQARRVARQRHDADDAARRAEEAAARADLAREAAEARVADCETAADTLADQWRTWLADEATIATFGPDAGWQDTPVAAAVADPAALLDDDADLDGLDRAATQAAIPVRARHTRAVATLDQADADAADQRATLAAEERQLRAAVDPEPATPTWLTSTGEDRVPLWRTVDFAPGLTDADRAGLEGALLSSGLLLAAVTDAGDLRAANGDLLLAPAGDPAAIPLSTVLVPDPASPLPAALIATVLDRIGYGPGPHPTWVAADGAWRNGPLTGRHTPDTARHIGAAARAEARRARLAEIAAEVADLDAAQDARAETRSALTVATRALEDRVGAAPRSQGLRAARGRATDATTAAGAAQQAARREAEAAGALRQQWRRALEEHEVLCRQFDLPTDVDDLTATQRQAEAAEAGCQALARDLTALDRLRDRHDQAVARAREEDLQRAAAETAAETDWSRWHRAAAELEAVRSTVGQEAAAIRAELARCETELERCRAQLKDARTRESDLTARSGEAKVEAATARGHVAAARTDLHDTAATLLRRYALPGVAAAALGTDPEPLTLPEVTVPAVRTLADAVLDRLPKHAGADENALIRAQQNLERDLSGTFDITAEVHDGIRLVELSDAAGRRTVPGAADALAKQVGEGRDALSDRERKVFTDFVLGGVAEELRRRLDQAAALIGAMNESLGTIKTSHGIGVRLRWKLPAEADPTIHRIRELVSTAGAVRSAAETAELTGLLKARVDEAFAADASAGYAAHLHAALDYRAWHTVEVVIAGPAAGQERRLGRKARLSQGEIRFVSYVTLFAAVDAYLSGLPDTTRALRLLLLDDAFAKVDDRTIGELMGLLVRLDVDFAMTGHALWGTYPQVPDLDCYEVRRVEGRAAVTTHIHWDGHTRHLRAAR